MSTTNIAAEGVPVRDLPADVRAGIVETLTSVARGCYQREIVSNWNAPGTWSGANLRGKAKGYGARYAASREGLLDRACEALAPHGYWIGTELRLVESRRRRVLVLAPLGAS